MDEKQPDKNIKEYLSEIGKKGGKKTALRGKQYYRDLQKKSMEGRRKKNES